VNVRSALAVGDGELRVFGFELGVSLLLVPMEVSELFAAPRPGGAKIDPRPGPHDTENNNHPQRRQKDRQAGIGLSRSRLRGIKDAGRVGIPVSAACHHLLLRDARSRYRYRQTPSWALP